MERVLRPAGARFPDVDHRREQCRSDPCGTLGRPPLHWLLWCGAASALATAVIVGLTNTTLHHEHGLLSTMLLGMWLGYRVRPAVMPNLATVRPQAV